MSLRNLLTFLTAMAAFGCAHVGTAPDGSKTDANFVQVVDSAPKGCQFVANVDVESERLIPALNGDSKSKHSLKKARHALEAAKERTAEAGANTIVLPRGKVDTQVLSGTAKTYYCKNVKAVETH